MEVFRTAQGQTDYLTAYNTCLATWPIPHEERTLATRFGRIHLTLAGEEDAPPLVLLPPAHSGAPVWSPNVAALGPHFRLIAFDLPGHAGKSTVATPVRTLGDAAAMILEALAPLTDEPVLVLGLSYGGWLALNLALQAPFRVRRLAVASPLAVFEPLQPDTLHRLLPLLLWGNRALAERFVDWASGGSDQLPAKVREHLVLGLQHARLNSPALFRPAPFAPDQLRRIEAPVLLLLGEHDPVVNARQSQATAISRLSDLEIGLVPGGGHFLTAEQPDVVNRRLLSFLDWLPLAR